MAAARAWLAPPALRARLLSSSPPHAAVAAVSSKPPRLTQETQRVFKQQMHEKRVALLAEGKHLKPPPAPSSVDEALNRELKNALRARKVEQDAKLKSRRLVVQALDKASSQLVHQTRRDVLFAPEMNKSEIGKFAAVRENLFPMASKIAEKSEDAPTALVAIPRPTKADYARAREERLKRSILLARRAKVRREAELNEKVEKLADEIQATWNDDLKQLQDVVPVNAPFLGILNTKHAKIAPKFADNTRAIVSMFGPPKPSGTGRPLFDPRVSAVLYLKLVKAKEAMRRRRALRDALRKTLGLSYSAGAPLPNLGQSTSALLVGPAPEGVRVSLNDPFHGLYATFKGTIQPHHIQSRFYVRITDLQVNSEGRLDITVVSNESVPRRFGKHGPRSPLQDRRPRSPLEARSVRPPTRSSRPPLSPRPAPTIDAAKQ